MSELLNRIKRKIASNTSYFVVIFILAVGSAIPLVYSWGKINIGYDTFLPFYPENSYKMVYQWTDRYNGIYTLNLYYVWILVLHVFKSLGLSIYHASSLLQFFIFFLSGLGLYKSFNLFSNERSKYIGLIPALFYIYSPHLLDHMLYQLGTIGIVWTIYFFLKFIKYKKFTFLDLVCITLSFATIIDLPNPKYHFLLFVTFVLMLCISLLLNLVRWSDVKANVKQFIVLILLSSYLLIPFVQFGYSFSKYNPSPISTKKDYAAIGETIDYGVAQIHKMIRLFHTPNLNIETIDQISQPFFSLIYYILPLLVIGLFPFIVFKEKSSTRKYYVLIYSMAIFFVFLSKGANPPFGSLYEFMITPQVLAFMRTTAGFVIYAAVFYALIIGFIFEHFLREIQAKIAVTLLFIFFILAWGYPFWSGKYYLNHPTPYLNSREHGITIPDDYFKAADYLAKEKLDAKIDVYPYADGYQSNKWGYYGFIFYPWLFRQPSISFEKNNPVGQVKSAVNVGFIVHDKSTVSEEKKPYTLPSYPLVFKSKIVDIYQTPLEVFRPHIYIPDSTLATDKIPKSFVQNENNTGPQLGIFSLKNPPETILKIPTIITHKPFIEYKKINPTKYRIIIHKAADMIPLIFLENYHPYWNIYLGNMNRYTYDQNKLVAQGSEYISPNLKGTIQNDNLPSGFFFETIGKRKIQNAHLKVNGYFNAWLLAPTELCKTAEGACVKNADGSYDIELIVEFGPQLISNLSIAISLFTLVGYFLYSFLKIKPSGT